jgi:plasmid stability protein
MNTTLELPNDLMTAVTARALRAGRPVQDVVAQLLRQALAADPVPPSAEDEAAMLADRRAIAEKFLSGEWGADLEGFEEGREHDRRKSAERAARWRE